MNPAKIRLSETEMELVTNADFILTKNLILKKAKWLLEDLLVKQQEYVALHAAGLPVKVSGSSPKISKGENYKGLPYLILDYPRLFEQEKLPDRSPAAKAYGDGTQAGIFAVRTMFWWGNFFSITLHLSGSYKNEFEQKLIVSSQVMKEKGYYCSIQDDQWEHHFEEDNYRLLSEMGENDFEKKVREKSFIKLATKISLQQWEDAEEILQGYFKEIIEILSD